MILHTLRNIPLARVDRTMALAYSMNHFGDTRMDSVFVIGASSRGLGFVGRSYIIKMGSITKTHRLPVEEHWETDLHLPPTAKVGLSGFGATPEVCTWFHQKFSKLIMQNINSAILKANKPIPKEVNLRMLGTNDGQPHMVADFLRECGTHLTQEEESGNKPPISSSDMALALAVWQTYSEELCVYNDGMPERNSKNGLMARLVLEAWSLSQIGQSL